MKVKTKKSPKKMKSGIVKARKVSTTKALSPKKASRKAKSNEGPTPRAESTVVCGFSDKGSLIGPFVHAGHAAHETKKNVLQIKEDISKGSTITGIYWFKIPAGHKLDTAKVEKLAKEAYDNRLKNPPTTKKRGRKPIAVDPTSVGKMLKSFNVENADPKMLKRIQAAMAPKK